MVTRASAAREAAFLASADSSTIQPIANDDEVAAGPSTSVSGQSNKRKRRTPKEEVAASSNPADEWDELPHNMGKMSARVKTETDNNKDVDIDDSAALEIEIAAEHDDTEKQENVIKSDIKTEDATVSSNLPDSPDLSELSATPELSDDDVVQPLETATQAVADDQSDVEAEQPPKKKVATPRKKKHPYGLTPGESPFPDWPMPTAKAAHEVHDLLTEVHGLVKAPKEIPQPSLEIAGCGEVPSVLDALIRTLLSAATSGTNSSRAFASLVETYGVYEDGIGKGSINWNKVRAAPLEEVEETIRHGGLAKAKSKNIKKILDIVHENNQARRQAFLNEKKTGRTPDVLGASSKSQKQKDLEIENSEVLSLQYMHGLDSEEVMTEFVKLPGIGVKTASCVILFCLQRPSFAVDTHVWRICKWLGWVPPNATRDQTFSHCEVRIPDELKYGLHQLFIKHGKNCLKCRAGVSERNSEWATTKCPIDRLVQRTGARKGLSAKPTAGSDSSEDEE